MTATAEASAPTELVLTQPLTPATQGAPSQAEGASLYELAKQLSRTGLVVRTLQGKPDDVMLILLIARDLRLAPTMALSRIHIVEGKPTLAAETMRGIVQRAGHHVHFEEMTNQQVTIVGWRHGEQEWPTRVTWSLQDARDAGLTNKSVWKSFPRAMLTARATSELCRAIFADVLLGMTYAPEDFDATTDNSGHLITSAPAPTTTPVDADWWRAIVFDAFDTEATFPTGHPYDGVDKPVDRLRRLWVHARDDLGHHVDGVQVADQDGQLVDARDFYTAAGKAATTGQPFPDRTDKGRQEPQAPASQADEPVEATLVDEPDNEPQAADEDVQDAEVVPDEPEPQPEPVDYTDGWLEELGFCAGVIGKEPGVLARRQLAQHDKEQVDELPVDALGQLVGTLRQPTVARLNAQNHEAVAAVYETRIAASINQPGRVPVRVDDLADALGD